MKRVNVGLPGDYHLGKVWLVLGLEMNHSGHEYEGRSLARGSEDFTKEKSLFRHMPDPASLLENNQPLEWSLLLPPLPRPALLKRVD